jgi:putative molybdopterin biosynthesis protein
MRISPTIAWKLSADHDEAIDPRLMPLLEAIAVSASLAAAVVQCGISYRAGWGLLRYYRQKLAVPLVSLERGRGASLTTAGRRLLEAHSLARQRLAGVLQDLTLDLGPAPRAKPRPAPMHLRVAASHDLALATLSEALAETAGITLELSVMGSLHALREYADGRADVAGFHVPMDRQSASERAPFLHWLRARRDRLVRFADRDQGLILARGNPARVKSLRDVADANLRFVNRQPGSGTRQLIDRMIADENIDAAALNRYGHEEFTHQAVAATVASGGADAGFGLRAAAAEYSLAFVPLVRERYFLAVRAKDIGRPPVARLIEALGSPAFARHVRRFPGYRLVTPGLVSGVEALAQK